jgi:dienelactone hydrolase
MPPLDEVAPGLWRFTVTRNGIPPTMTAYALRDGEDTIMVDPLVVGQTEPLLAELFLYPGDRHLFADNSLPDYDEDAAAVLRERVLAFLKVIE